jgi:hypothetical protein
MQQSNRKYLFDRLNQPIDHTYKPLKSIIYGLIAIGFLIKLFIFEHQALPKNLIGWVMFATWLTLGIFLFCSGVMELAVLVRKKRSHTLATEQPNSPFAQSSRPLHLQQEGNGAAAKQRDQSAWIPVWVTKRFVKMKPLLDTGAIIGWCLMWLLLTALQIWIVVSRH